jgi:hypothetical protein
MTVATSLALGTLAVLTGSLSTAMNVAMANMPAQPSWGACMAASHFLFGAPINWQTSAACLGIAIGGTSLLINRALVWWGVELDVRVGQALFTALRLARFAAAAAGPIGFFVLLGQAFRK